MATFTDHHQAYHNNWSCSDLPSGCEDPQGISISKILSHGSISFGRFAAESLAWEKWSVFSHNRCQEELEKFPGIVAQKKAYFEEYYRRIRALKAAEAEAQKQETTHEPGPYQDDLTASMSAEDSIDDTESKEEEQTNAVTQIQFSGTETTCPNLSGDSIENKSEAAMQQRYSTSSNGNSIVGNEADFSISAFDLGHSPELAFPESVPQSDSSSEEAHQNGLISDIGTVNLGSCQQEDITPVLKPKATVASARNRTKPACKPTNNALKPSEKLKPSSQKKVAGHVDKKLQARRETSSKPAGNTRSNSSSSDGSPIEVASRATVLRSSTARAKPMLPPASRSAQTKISLNTKVLPEKLKSRLPVNTLSSLSARSTQKEITTKVNMVKVATDNRSTKVGVAWKSSDLTSCNMTPKGGRSMNQRPTAMSTTPSGQNKLSKNIGTESSHRSYYRGHIKEGQDQSITGQQRFPKLALSNARGIYKSPSPGTKKITTLQSAELKQNQRECNQPRPKTRGWL